MNLRKKSWNNGAFFLILVLGLGGGPSFKGLWNSHVPLPTAVELVEAAPMEVPSNKPLRGDFSMPRPAFQEVETEVVRASMPLPSAVESAAEKAAPAPISDEQYFFPKPLALPPQKSQTTIGSATPYLPFSESADEVILLGKLESFFMVEVQKSTKHLATYLQAMGSEGLTKKIQTHFPREIKDLMVKIAPDGFQGSGSLWIEDQWVPIEYRVALDLDKDQPQVRVRQISVAGTQLLDRIIRLLEVRLNRILDEQWRSIKFKQV